MDRDAAAAVARFRLKYGPDRISLRKRGLLMECTDACRFCGMMSEDEVHLLFECVEKYFLTLNLPKLGCVNMKDLMECLMGSRECNVESIVNILKDVVVCCEENELALRDGE